MLTPLYLGCSWVLTVSYQIFTNTAVKTISSVLNGVWPSAATWLYANIQTVSFVYAFSWIFLLSSVLPALLLGKERSILIQYLVCMVLTLLALTAQNFLSIHDRLQSILGVSVFLERPYLAIVYLLIPFIFMLTMDARSKWKRSKSQKDQISGILDGSGSNIHPK